MFTHVRICIPVFDRVTRRQYIECHDQACDDYKFRILSTNLLAFGCNDSSAHQKSAYEMDMTAAAKETPAMELKFGS